MKTVLSLLLLYFTGYQLGAQYFQDQKRDYAWITGDNVGDPVADSLVGITLTDFRVAPPSHSKLNTSFTLYIANASICDTAGNLLLYTNGLELRNHAHELVEGGEVLEVGEPGSNLSGYPIHQSVLLLPFPGRDSQYVLFNEEAIFSNDEHVITWNKFKWNIIDMNKNSGLGKVAVKDSILLNTLLDRGQVTATRHANGRDWWVIVAEFFTNGYFTFLLDTEGVHFQGKQEVGPEVPANRGQAVFAPNGGKYCKVNSHSYTTKDTLIIMDFDRCSGTLSNPLLITKFDSTDVQGVSISSNSRYLYWTCSRYVYQLDLYAEDIAASRMRVAEWDGFAAPFSTNFFLAQLAPDGKIYINSTNGTNYLHVINRPNQRGEACEVCQHCVELPSYNAASMPIFPNYRLGPIDGSPCDTLGIDNVVAVEEVERVEQAGLAVYPNPADESLVVEYAGKPLPGAVLRITSTAGQIFILQPLEKLNENRLDISTLKPGMYYIHLVSPNGILALEKLVVIR